MTEEQLSTIWKSVLHDIEIHFSPAIFKTWFKHSHLIQLKPGLAEISVENNFAKNFIKKFAEERLVASLSQHASFPISLIQYTIQPPAPATKSGPKAAQAPSQDLFTDQGTQPASQPLPRPGTPLDAPMPSNLNPKYTFDTFIVGNRNRLAYAAAKAVAEGPGKTYNPLYLYGGVGLGKTHLMQAVGNEVIRREPQKRILYVSCENFMNEFVVSIQRGKQEDFKKKYRNVDIFLVDDIQFIAGKEGTQEEFFHTFNALYQTDKQIIITSDKVPSEITGLEERLSSRFSSGMIADMQLPDLETRQAILQAKCLERNIHLSDDILYYIADQVETNIRELEGALTTVLLHIQAAPGEPVTLESVRQAIKAFASPHKPSRKTSFEQISAIICEFYGVEFKQIEGPQRHKELVRPRQILMYLMKQELGMTFPMIGRQIGGRDHTTAMHAVDKIQKELKKSPELLEEIQRIKELFYAGSK